MRNLLLALLYGSGRRFRIAERNLAEAGGPRRLIVSDATSDGWNAWLLGRLSEGMVSCFELQDTGFDRGARRREGADFTSLIAKRDSSG